MSKEIPNTPDHIVGEIQSLFTSEQKLVVTSTIITKSQVQAKQQVGPKFIKAKKKKINFVSAQERAHQEALTRKLIDEAIACGKVTRHPAMWAQDSRSMQLFEQR